MFGGSISTKNNLIKARKQHKKNILDLDLDLVDNTNNEYKLTKTRHSPSNEYKLLGDDNLDIRKKSIKEGRAIIVWFEIITDYIKPYIRYRLCKSSNSLTFEYYNTKANEIPKIQDASYIGLHEYEETQYLFFINNKADNVVINITTNDKYYFLLIDDIVNIKSYYDISVAEEVTKFFIKNDQFIYLIDENDVIIEIPISGYRGEYYKKIGLLAGLGVPRSGPSAGAARASLGPYFYFGDFKRSLRYASITIDGKPKEVAGEKITILDSPVFTKGGMVKYALFMGNTKVMLNLKNDVNDNSRESLILSSHRKFIKDTLKLRDTDGNWTAHFDSVIQPKIKIFDRDSGFERQLDAQFVVKSFEQQVPIDFAYFKTSHITKNKETGLYNTSESIMI